MRSVIICCIFLSAVGLFGDAFRLDANEEAVIRVVHSENIRDNFVDEAPLETSEFVVKDRGTSRPIKLGEKFKIISGVDVSDCKAQCCVNGHCWCCIRK